MDLNIIVEIEEKCNVKEIKKCCKRILKKLSFKSAKDLRNVADLVTLLYIFDYYAEAIKVSQIIKDIHFIGNYTIWSEVQFVKYNIARIFREQGKLRDIPDLLCEVNSLQDESLFSNQAMCLDLYTHNSLIAKENNMKRDEISWKLLKFQKMINFYEIEGFPLDKKFLNGEIISLKNELKGLIK